MQRLKKIHACAQMKVPLIILLFLIQLFCEAMLGPEYGHVRKCVMLSITFWTIYLLDLARNYIDKL